MPVDLEDPRSKAFLPRNKEETMEALYLMETFIRGQYMLIYYASRIHFKTKFLIMLILIESFARGLRCPVHYIYAAYKPSLN